MRVVPEWRIMTQLGFKTLTTENWLEPEEILKAFVSLSSDGHIQSITSEAWAQRILEPHLSQAVPHEIQRLFEVARGAMIYGYFFYPLYTLALEQVFRVVETAVSDKCRSMAAPKPVRTFEQKINWLTEQSVIAAGEREQWHAIRGFRNITSHPTTQMILTPGNTIGFLSDMVSRINSLFDN